MKEEEHKKHDDFCDICELDEMSNEQLVEISKDCGISYDETSLKNLEIWDLVHPPIDNRVDKEKLNLAIEKIKTRDNL